MRIILYLCLFFLLISNECCAQGRFISLAPSTTEILFSLGLDEEIVGVSSYCDYPEKAGSKAKIGDFSRPNIEKILSLKPDYIFCTGLEQASTVIGLRRLKQKVFVSDPKNVKELIDSIIEIGKITNKEHAACMVTASMEEELHKINEAVISIPQEKRPRVFLEIWDNPLTTAGEGSFVDELITLAGGVNIARDTKRAYSIFSAEEVIKRNPDCVIVTFMNKRNSTKIVGQRFGWGRISAVKNNRVYNDIDRDLLLRPGPRVIAGIKELFKRFYPSYEKDL